MRHERAEASPALTSVVEAIGPESAPVTARRALRLQPATSEHSAELWIGVVEQYRIEATILLAEDRAGRRA